LTPARREHAGSKDEISKSVRFMLRRDFEEFLIGLMIEEGLQPTAPEGPVGLMASEAFETEVPILHV
jgi:hypothetical protein